MDERIHEHAEVLVDWSARVEAGDDVVLSVAEGAHDLTVAVAEKLGERGANPLVTYDSDEVSRAYLTAYDGEFGTGEHELAMIENADVYLRLGGGRNTSALADVSGEVRQAYATASAELREARMKTDWVSTVHPTRSLAQQAGMAYEEYRDFAYDAILRDWESLADEMAEMKNVLDSGSEVRIEKEKTDLTMSIEGRTAVNSAASVAYDSHNLPSGEVFTAPHATEGEVLFDVPMTVNGKRLRDVSLTFEGGEVVDFSAGVNEDELETILDTDDGARRLGELGIGMNRGIDRFTDNILFDEKMGDTIHLALGRAYDACLPEGEEGNGSAVHVDLITDMSEGRMEVDGEVVQRNGVFDWEEGFEG
ncbi:thermophilic metalloprotease M29 [Halalkalicoccus paucihalophilus]|uniref:Thermophilic metalloprotease M29 n=1 Tax=Halalkalicoccus paucihalophilus TaxID=1008153 RepID=A0A151AJL5_9EURY|nr:aminopeptidase [Halalkalicoccus paucihalophilus]KYH27849.1 thermophilic metalloprotease M29 [Halalkalicoccus paucihalophilus]